MKPSVYVVEKITCFNVREKAGAVYRLYVYSDCRTENPETKVVRREGGVHRVITVISAGTIAFH